MKTNHNKAPYYLNILKRSPKSGGEESTASEVDLRDARIKESVEALTETIFKPVK